jgi:hypothetical protein
MIRQLTVLMLIFSLALTACMPVAAPAAPAATSAPTEEAEIEATGVVEEETAAEATAEATEEAASETDEEEATDAEAQMGCPEPDAETHLISSTAAGYCFLIPANFERSEFSDDEGFNIGIYGPASTPGHRERAFVNVTAAGAATLEEGVQAVVDEVLASLPGFTPTQSSLTLGGLPAIQLDNLPGQDINRKVYALYEGRLYELTFVPFDELRPDAQAEMEQLYEMVVESFRFMPATDMASSYAPLLTWEGEIEGACHTLTIEPSGDATVGVCGDEPSSTASLQDSAEWEAVQQHFGSIDAETSAGQINFIGQGSAESDLWAQALATWASFTAMEIKAGRAGAAARTTLAWQLTTEPEHSSLCSQLLVLAYGYAYANQIPCEGSGQSSQVGMGWLSDTELDAFMQWINEGGRVESELGYLDAHGSTPITPEEITFWANAVYTRLLQ